MCGMDGLGWLAVWDLVTLGRMGDVRSGVGCAAAVLFSGFWCGGVLLLRVSGVMRDMGARGWMTRFFLFWIGQAGVEMTGMMGELGDRWGYSLTDRRGDCSGEVACDVVGDGKDMSRSKLAETSSGVPVPCGVWVT